MSPAKPYYLIGRGGGGGNVDPSNIPLSELVRFRGAIWTRRGPWRFGPRPLQPDNITAMEYIYSYGDQPEVSPLKTGLNAEQQAMIKAYKGPDMLTHVAFGPPNAQSYHGQYPDYNFLHSREAFEVWLDWLQVFWNNKLAPACFLHPDNATFEQTRDIYEPLIRNNPRAQKLMRIVVPTGWEPTKYGWSSNTWAMFCAWARDILPNALVGIHTVADVDAPVGTDENGDDNGKPNGQGWSRVAPHIHFWLIQNGAYDCAPSENPALAREFASQFKTDGDGALYHSPAWHFANSIDGWPNFSAFGPNVRIKLINGEDSSYYAYWENLPQASSQAWGNLAVASGADGYFDDGTVAVP